MPAPARAAEVIVVGAGPAGAATAILLAEAGHEVWLLDRARFPRPKLCGEYLSPGARRVLARLGVARAVEAAARPLRGMRIVAPDGTTLVGDYPGVPDGRGGPARALAVSRETFDAVLAARAAERATLREGFRVTDLLLDGDRVVGVEGFAEGAPGLERLRARLVVGADGRGSVVAHRLGLVRPHPWLQRLALVAYLEGVAQDGTRGEIFLAPPAYAIVNPVRPDRVNLSLVVPAAVARREKGRLAAYFDHAVAGFPHLGPRLRAARRVSPVRGLAPLAYRVAAPRHGGVLLAGDALGFLDPFTGEGLFAALRSAELVAEVAHGALRAGTLSAAALAPARARHRAAFAGKARLASLLQRAILRPRPTLAVAHRLARHPAVLERVLGVFGDLLPPRALLAPRVLASLLAWDPAVPTARSATPGSPGG